MIVVFNASSISYRVVHFNQDKIDLPMVIWRYYPIANNVRS